MSEPSRVGWRGDLGYLATLSRPRFWLYLAGPVLVGAAFGAGSLAALGSPKLWLLFLYALLPANLLLYGINDRYDRELDAANPKKEDREARYRGGRATGLALGLSLLVSILLLWLLRDQPAVLWPLAGFLFLSWAYSAPPLRFKARPYLDSLSNGLYILPGVAAYGLLAGQAPPTAAILGGWLWTMAMHSFSAIPDIEPDREAGIRTTAIALGARGTLAYCGLCWLGAGLAFATIAPGLGLLLLPYPLLMLWIAWRRPDVAQVYWWFPAINTALGMALTLIGLWRLATPGDLF